MTLAIDGTPQGVGGSGTGNIFKVTLNTSNGNDAILVAGSCRYSATIDIIGIQSTSGLNYLKRKSLAATAGGYHVDTELWYAEAPSPLTNEVISVTWSASGGTGNILAFAVSGASVSAPFDTNSSLPASASHSTSAVPSVGGVSTTASNTMLIGLTWTQGSPPSPGAGYTTVGSVFELDVQYQIVSTPQTGDTVSFGSGDGTTGFVMIADALQVGAVQWSGSGSAGVATSAGATPAILIQDTGAAHVVTAASAPAASVVVHDTGSASVSTAAAASASVRQTAAAAAVVATTATASAALRLAASGSAQVATAAATDSSTAGFEIAQVSVTATAVASVMRAATGAAAVATATNAPSASASLAASGSAAVAGSLRVTTRQIAMSSGAAAVGVTANLRAGTPRNASGSAAVGVTAALDARVVSPVVPAYQWQTPTTLQQTTPAYPYQQYQDDDNVQALFAAFNTLAQQYINAFNSLNLPVYTGDNISGALLDWVAQGLYGISRPSLPSGRTRQVGQFNTYQFNALRYDFREQIGPANYYATNDDTFKRIITWAFLKGDGKYFNIRWLKRRVMRFLFGANGVNYNVDQSYIVSVTFGVGNQVNIRILPGIRTVTGGALYNRFGFNQAVDFNQIFSTYQSFVVPPEAPIFQAAVEAGVLELPFQYEWVVTI